MKQRVDYQKVSKKDLRRSNTVLLTLGALSCLAASVLRCNAALITPTPLYVVIALICGTYVATRSKSKYWMYLISIIVSVLVIWLFAVGGFYRPNLSILNDVTGRPDKSVSNAAIYSFIAPEWLTTTALFNCDTTYGQQCTMIENATGVVFDYGILSVGVIVGNLLVRH